MLEKNNNPFNEIHSFCSIFNNNTPLLGLHDVLCEAALSVNQKA